MTSGGNPWSGKGGSPRVVVITTVAQSLRAVECPLRFLQSRGYDIHVVTTPEPYLEEFQRMGFGIHTISMTRRISPFADFMTLCRLAKLIRHLSPHIVHAHTPKAGLLGMLASSWAGVPIRIYHVRGLRYQTARHLTRQLLVSCERVACRCATHLLSVSHGIRECLVTDRITSGGRIRVLGKGGHGTDIIRFDPRAIRDTSRDDIRVTLEIPKDATVIGYVGRIARDKGIEVLAKTWVQVRQRYKHVHLIIAGSHDQADPVPVDLLSLLRNDPRVHIVDYVRDAVPYYAAMDLVCLPSYREGLPKVLLEAAAMELPVVATDIAGCVDAVEDGVTGMLVPPRDSRSFAEAITYFMERPFERERFGRNGRDRIVRDFSQATACDALLGLYRELLGAKGIATMRRRARRDSKDRRAA